MSTTNVEATIAVLTEKLAAAVAERDDAVRLCCTTAQENDKLLKGWRGLQRRVKAAEHLVEISDRVIAQMARALFTVELVTSGHDDPELAAVTGTLNDWRRTVRSEFPPHLTSSALEALAPFATVFGDLGKGHKNEQRVLVSFMREAYWLTVGDLRRAAAVFNAKTAARRARAAPTDPIA